jgi:hypothetical protein
MAQDALTTPDIQQLKREHGDWLDDYERLTGEPFSVASFVRRVHSDDLREAIRGWVKAQQTGKFKCEYRLLLSSGGYVKVRGSVLRYADIWVGYIRVIGGIDTPRMSAKIVSFAKNAAMITIFDFVIYLAQSFMS